MPSPARASLHVINTPNNNNNISFLNITCAEEKDMMPLLAGHFDPPTSESLATDARQNVDLVY